MKFNLNEFLRSVANSLDIIEIEIFGMPINHSKRIAYISVLLAQKLELTNEEMFDIASLAILHDNGAGMKVLHDVLRGDLNTKLNILESRKEHCIIGEQNLVNFPFITHPKNVILYHHEKFDGSGFFGISGKDIPVFAQIISLADTLDLTFNLNKTERNKIISFVREKQGVFFAKEICLAFFEVANNGSFWEGMLSRNIDKSLDQVIPVFTYEYNMDQIRKMTQTFSRIIDAKSKYTQAHSSGLAQRILKMAQFYKIDRTTTTKLLIAADLHDIGKLGVSNDILEKPESLTSAEYSAIMKHPQIAKTCLEGIKGFEEITEWIYNHHERLDGSGYPRGIKAENLDFNSRLISCLDIYQALREERPYRKSMNHREAMKILGEMAQTGKIDAKITQDIDTVFKDA